MNNLSRSNRARQARAKRVITNLPGYADTTVTWWPGTLGNPAEHPTVRIIYEDGRELSFHFMRATLAIDGIANAVVDLVSAGLGQIAAPVLRPTNGALGIHLHQAETLIARWRAAERVLLTGRPFHMRGRTLGSTDVTREQWDRALAKLKHKYPRTSGRDGLIHAMAGELFVSTKTIKRYRSKGWPL